MYNKNKMICQITDIELFGSSGTSIGGTGFVKLLSQGSSVYHYERLHRGNLFLIDNEYKNKGFNLYVRSGAEHGFVLNEKLENYEKLCNLIRSVAPDANVDVYILALLEHGYYTIRQLDNILDDGDTTGLIEYLRINRTGNFVHIP